MKKRERKHADEAKASAPLPSHRRKLAWANAHIDDVEATLDEWSVHGDGYRTFVEPKSKGSAFVCAEQLKPLPDELPLVIGDAFQCLRNSLDHIVFTLSKKNPAMTPDDEDVPQFPITNKALPLNHRWIRFLSEASRKEVCALSPDPERQPLDQDPLWLLNKMSNRDKHREVGVVAVGSAVSDWGGISTQGAEYFRPCGMKTLQEGAGPMALCEFSHQPGTKVEITGAVKTLFDQSVEVANREVIATLRWIHDHIRDTVFQRLEPGL